MEIEIEIYKTQFGKNPFLNWIKRLKDSRTRAKILFRLERLRVGNFGDCKSVGGGVFELRIHYGPGIRVYYSKVGTKIILLLCGGDKGSQIKDIKNAQEFLEDYKMEKVNHG